MLVIYRAVYSDRHGEVSTSIANDGHMLHMQLRGVGFSGTMFDDFEPHCDSADPQLKTFVFSHGSLCSCTLACDIPLSVIWKDEIQPARLHMRLVLGDPRKDNNAAIDQESLGLTLTVADHTVVSCGKHGWFENELGEVQGALPEGMYLKSCFTCAFSDYSPAGQPLFGGMACFRDTKDAYRRVNGKKDLIALWDQRTEFVQEMYVCSEFERRLPDAGHRG